MARTELKNVMHHGRLYGLANLVSRFSGLVLLPLYAHLLSPTEFGLYTSTILITDLVSVVLGMGLGRALVRLHVEQQDQAGKDAVLWTAMAAFAGMAVVIIAAAYPVSLLATRLLFGDTDVAWLFTLAIWALVPTTLFNLQLNYIIVLKQSFFYLVTSILKATLFIAFNLWLVLWMGYGVFGIVVSTLVASAIVVAVVLGRMLRSTTVRVSKPILVDLLKFSAPLIPTILLDTISASLDRYFIAPAQGAAALGQYGLGLRLASLLNLLVTSPFMQIWGVRQMEALQEGQEGRELPNLFFQFTLVLMTMCVGLGLFSGEIIRIIADEAFAPAASVIPWLAAVQVVTALRSFGEVGLHFAKRTAPLMTISLCALLVAVPAYWVAAQMTGLVGVAIACFGVALFRTGLTVYWADKHSSLVRQLPWGRLAIAALLGVSTVALGGQLGGSGWLLQDALVKLGAFSLFAALALVLILRVGAGNTPVIHAFRRRQA